MTTSEILQIITENDIFCKYFQSNFIVGKQYKSPFRTERTASFNIYKSSNGSLRFKDYGGGGDQGSCFDFVMLTKNLSFQDALQRICFDFGITEELYKERKPFFKYTRDKAPGVEIVYRKKYSYEEKPFPEYGVTIDFWNKSGITIDVLKEYNVKNIKSFTHHGFDFEHTISAVPFKPLFVHVSDDKEGIFKFYNPFVYDKKKKFKTSRHPSDDLWGRSQIKEFQDIICLNGGERDGLSLFSNTKIRPVCACSESTYPNEDQIEDLQSMCNFICILYDNDDAGKKMTARLLNKYPYLIPINIAELTSCNDISEYCEWCLKNNQNNQLKIFINESVERYILQSVAY